MRLFGYEVETLVPIQRLGSGRWVCSQGRCTRPAVYATIKPTKNSEEHKGLCQTGGERYAKRRELPLPDLDVSG